MVLARCLSFLLLLIPFAAVAQTGLTPLFQQHDVLEVRIAAPLTTLMRVRSDEDQLPATLTWTGTDGAELSTELKLRARGNYRRKAETCPFPPVRLNFRTGDVAGTVFEGQDIVKLVTHCRNGSKRFEQLLVREYLVYRMLAELTDVSYRVRLLRVNWHDTESGESNAPSLAIAIEHKDRLAARSGLALHEVASVEVADLHPARANLAAIFNFMIGNTDYSPIRGASGEDCCHNVHLFLGDDGLVTPIPYDFDMSGMIDAPYATPNPRFGLRDVRQRLYRGRCENNAEVAATIASFNAKKTAFESLIKENAFLSSSSQLSMQRYVKSFFVIAERPKRIERQLIKRCVG